MPFSRDARMFNFFHHKSQLSFWAPPHSTTSGLFESPFRRITSSKGNRMPIWVFRVALVVSWMGLPEEEAERLLANRIQ